MISLTRIAQFHGYLYSPIGEDKKSTLVRVEHKVAISVATAGKTAEDMVARTAKLSAIVDPYFAERFHEHLMIRADEPKSAKFYMDKRTDFAGLYISQGDNSALSLSAELLNSMLHDILLDEEFLFYRALVRRSDQDAQYTTMHAEEARAKWCYCIDGNEMGEHVKLAKLLRPIGENLPTRSRRKRNF